MVYHPSQPFFSRREGDTIYWVLNGGMGSKCVLLTLKVPKSFEIKNSVTSYTYETQQRDILKLLQTVRHSE